MSLHKKISFVKSAIRILGYGLLAYVWPTYFMWVVAIVLILSEIIGIIEELGEK